MTYVGTTTNECRRCSEVETWEHVVQCRKIVNMRVEFVQDLYEDLKKVQTLDVSHAELRLLTNDTRKFMREDADDFETNQQIIGMKCLFRCFSVKARKSTQIGEKRYAPLNIIINQHCMACY